MPSTLWEDIKRTVKQGVSVAAEKTEEYTKIGKIKVEILNVNRTIDKTYAEIGKEVFGLIDKGKKAEVVESEKVKKLVSKVKEQKALLKKKEAEIEAIKKEAEKGEEPEKPPAEAKPATAAKKSSATTAKKKTGTKTKSS